MYISASNGRSRHRLCGLLIRFCQNTKVANASLKPFYIMLKSAFPQTSRINKLFDLSALSLSRAGYLALVVMMTLTLTNCAKQEIPTDADTTTKMTMDRKALLKNIIGRTGDLRSEGATLRSESTHTIAEALDLLDEALNYAYCRPATPLQETIILSDTLIMAVDTSSTVTGTVIATLFDEASDNIGAQYHALSLTNQQPWVFSVSQFGDIENSELPIIVQLEVAYGGYITEAIVYDENEDYSYLYQGGLCDETTGPGAPELLRDNLKHAYVYNPSNPKYFLKPYYMWVCNPNNWDGGGNLYCRADGLSFNLHKKDQTELNKELKGHPNFWNNINDWRLFRQRSSVGNYDKCLSGDVEMPHCETEMGKYIANHGPGGYYKIGNIWVGSFDYTTGGQVEVIFHNMIVAYYFVAEVDPGDPVDVLPCPGC
jgi:hypothetical protein